MTAAVSRRSPFWQLARVEATLFLRERAAPLWGIGLPVLLLVIFGAIPAFRKPLDGSDGLTVLGAYLPILVIMSLALLCLVLLPMTVVSYRERGVLRRLRTTPAGPARVLGAQVVVSIGITTAALLVLLLLARAAYGVPFPRLFGGWALTVAFAAASMLGMGAFVAAVAPTSRAAGGIGNILFYPMMFFSGLWLPIPAMPAALQHVAHATPLGAAWAAFQQTAVGHWPPMLSLVTMAAWGLAFGAAAVRFFRWE